MESDFFPKKIAKRRGRPRKAQSWTPALLAERSNEYFAKCDDRTVPVVTKEGVEYVPKPIPYTIEGLLCHLDVSRYDFEKWRHQDNAMGRMAERIRMRICENRVVGALDGTQNPSFAQFLLKNTDSEAYKDKTEIEAKVPEKVMTLLEQSIQKWSVSE